MRGEAGPDREDGAGRGGAGRCGFLTFKKISSVLFSKNSLVLVAGALHARYKL